jgi:hypothetical protein
MFNDVMFRESKKVNTLHPPKFEVSTSQFLVQFSDEFIVLWIFFSEKNRQNKLNIDVNNLVLQTSSFFTIAFACQSYIDASERQNSLKSIAEKITM